MYARNFRNLAVVSSVLSVLAIGCNSKPEVVGPDPALAGSAQAQGGAAPANQGSSTDPPPNSGKKKSAGTLQDLCRSTVVQKAIGGVARTYVKFQKDGSTILIDACRTDGAEAVSFEKFNFKDRVDLHVAANSCPTGSSRCWYKVYDLKGKNGDLGYSTLSELNLSGRYKTGESTTEIPADAQVTFGVLLDDSGGVSSTAVAAAKRYHPKPVDLGPVLTRLDALDARLTKVEATTSQLVVAMAAYSDMVRRDEAM